MRKIKILVMDVDGTLTDGKIYMGVAGEMIKVFDIKDGCGIHDILPQNDIIPIIITARESQIVINRCNELGIKEIHQNCHDKLTEIKRIAEQYGIVLNENEKYEAIAYIGDDLVDIPAMKMCGIVGCPCDAVDNVRKIADYISKYQGGNGAVRDFIEWIINEENQNSILP